AVIQKAEPGLRRIDICRKVERLQRAALQHVAPETHWGAKDAEINAARAQMGGDGESIGACANNGYIHHGVSAVSTRRAKRGKQTILIGGGPISLPNRFHPYVSPKSRPTPSAAARIIRCLPGIRYRLPLSASGLRGSLLNG